MSERLGWFSLDRSIEDHWAWKEKPFSKGQAWVDLIMHARFSHKPDKILIKGKLYTINRGQQARSEKTLSAEWGWSRDKVRRFLSHLKSDQSIIQQSDSKTSIITIVNYDKYQTRATADNTALDTSNKTTPAHHPHTEEQRNNVTKREEVRGECRGEMTNREQTQTFDGQRLPAVLTENKLGDDDGAHDSDARANERKDYGPGETVGGGEMQDGNPGGYPILGISGGSGEGAGDVRTESQARDCQYRADGESPEIEGAEQKNGKNYYRLGDQDQEAGKAESGSRASENHEIGNWERDGGLLHRDQVSCTPLSEKKDSGHTDATATKSSRGGGKMNGKKASVVIDPEQLPNGLSEDLAREYVEYRRSEKKKPLTQRAFTEAVAGFSLSATEAGLPIEWVVRYAMLREWLIARPEWIIRSADDIIIQFGGRDLAESIRPSRHNRKDKTQEFADILQQSMEDSRIERLKSAGCQNGANQISVDLH